MAQLGTQTSYIFIGKIRYKRLRPFNRIFLYTYNKPESKMYRIQQILSILLIGFIFLINNLYGQENNNNESQINFIKYHNIDKARGFSKGQNVKVAILDWMFNIKSDSSNKYINPKFKDGWGYSNGPPIVAGVVALMKSVNNNLTVSEIKNILVETSRNEHGFKVLDAEAAVKAALKNKY